MYELGGPYIYQLISWQVGLVTCNRAVEAVGGEAII